MEAYSTLDLSEIGCKFDSDDTTFDVSYTAEDLDSCKYGDADTNILLNVATSQVSLYTAAGATAGIPDHAVDGNTSGTFGDHSCTHTLEESSNSWWQADIGESYYVKYVKIYNRVDCCTERLNNYYVYVGDNSDYT